MTIFQDDWCAYIYPDWTMNISPDLQISEKVLDLMGKYGIGVALTPEGNYDYERGILLDDIPFDEQEELTDAEIDEFNALAEDFAEYSKEAARIEA